MKIAIHQPQYLPWLGYFDKMDQSDVFVLLDDVQYKKNEWQNRNKIRNSEGWQWITVPVLYEFGQEIREVNIDTAGNWREKHIKSIELNYSKAPYFDKYFTFFLDIFEREWQSLSDLNTHFIEYFKETLGIKAKLIRSSNLNVQTSSTERLVDICKLLEADVYLSGAGGEEYLDVELFKQSGIGLEFQAYKHPRYEQVYEGFEPYMAVADLLFCQGDKSIEIIREGRKK
ncbi:MAG: WbqC family protein [Candidatus Omnitrophota bacterium]